MKKFIIPLMLFGAIFLSFMTNASAQGDTAKKAAPPIKVTAELVSHYVWRGSMATGSPTPNFQPTLAYSKENFEIGVWGSTDYTGSYKEVDPYVSLTAGQFKFTLTDYDWNFGRANYFNYKNKETGHIFEGAVAYTGPATFPISISWNTMFAGFDQKGNSIDAGGNYVNFAGADSAKQAFSTYIELGYTQGPASFFLGFTPWTGYYNNYGLTAFDPTMSKKTFSVVNVGVTLSRSVKITNDFSLPLRATLVLNPAASYKRMDYLHLVFGITF